MSTEKFSVSSKKYKLKKGLQIGKFIVDCKGIKEQIRNRLIKQARQNKLGRTQDGTPVAQYG